MITLHTRLAPLIAAMLLVVAPLAAQAPPPVPPSSPPPPVPVVVPTAAALPVTNTAPSPSTVAPGQRATDAAPVILPQSQTPPVGATMRCKDGTWLFGAPNAARCDRNGGLATILPVRAAPPPPPPRAP